MLGFTSFNPTYTVAQMMIMAKFSNWVRFKDRVIACKIGMIFEKNSIGCKNDSFFQFFLTI